MIARFSRVLASTRGTIAAIGVMAALAAFAVHEVNVIRHKLLIDEAVKQTPELRSALLAISLSDRILRVLDEMKEAEETKTYIPLTQENFVGAMRSFERNYDTLIAALHEGPQGELTDAAVADLQRAKHFLETAWINDLSDPTVMRAEFSDIRNSLRQNLPAYFDDVSNRRREEFVRREAVLEMFANGLKGGIAVLIVFFLGLLFLLRQEVVSYRRREEAEQRVDYLSRNNALTGLPNRSQLHRFLAEQIESNRCFQLLLIDIKGFGAINETYGHTTGDGVLKALAGRLLARADSGGGQAVHLGADEFALILPLGEDKSRDRSALFSGIDEVSVQIGVNRVLVNTAIGRVKSDSLDIGGTRSVDDVVRAAELALSEAKYRSCEKVVTYTPELEDRHSRRRELLEAIPRAIENKEFFVAFQPKVDLADGRIYGFEALIRWRHEGTVISPGDFVPLAEETRLIIDLDLLVLRDAVRQVARWNRATGRSYAISVNLSAHHFGNDDIVTIVSILLADLDFDPALLTLEITETVMLDDWRGVQSILAQLSELGVKISLDDFGTGYSSLAYLRRISADELKIDRSFVTEIEQSSEAQFVLDAIVDIATGLGMTIVVEGIETEAQARIVSGFGCDRGQGYLWGAPKPAEETELAILEQAA